MAGSVSNATLRYQKMTFLAAGRNQCGSKQEPLRQQAGDIAAASRSLCGSKQEASRQQAETIICCYHGFCILHFAFNLRLSLLTLGKVEASFTFLSLNRSLDYRRACFHSGKSKRASLSSRLLAAVAFRVIGDYLHSERQLIELNLVKTEGITVYFG
ncbi:MAG: hypothetical protein K5945_05015 [Bacteroidaceae bacterium]|nr:hypothetical protein [Bacteroidaceae bacterium]